MTLSPGEGYGNAQSMMLCAPGNDVSVKEGITIGGGQFAMTLGFDGKWNDLPVSGSHLSINLPAGSAIVVKLISQ